MAFGDSTMPFWLTMVQKFGNLKRWNWKPRSKNVEPEILRKWFRENNTTSFFKTFLLFDNNDRNNDSIQSNNIIEHRTHWFASDPFQPCNQHEQDHNTHVSICCPQLTWLVVCFVLNKMRKQQIYYIRLQKTHICMWKTNKGVPEWVIRHAIAHLPQPPCRCTCHGSRETKRRAIRQKGDR